MYRLIISNLKRLKNDKFFWFSILFFILISILMCFKQHQMAINNGGETPIENVLFWGEMVIGIAISIFTNLFVGKDYSDGTIRNKLIIGHSRFNIYFSNLFICIFAGFIINLAYIIPCLIIGYFWFPSCYLELDTIFFITIDIIFMIISFSSIFNLIAMIFSNKTNGAVVSLMLAFILFFASAGIFSALIQPKYIKQNVFNEDRIDVEDVKNPNYIEGNDRKIYELALNTLPSGQAMQYTIVKIDNIKTLFINSFFVILISNLIGFLFFNRKNLK